MKTSQSLAPMGNASMQKNIPFSQTIGSPNYQRMLETSIADPKRRANFVSSLISAVATTPGLKNCAPDTIVSAALPFVSFDFSFGTGCAYIIPYGDKATFQMGAKGYRQLAMRSGMYKDLDTIEVRQGEFLGRDTETGKPIFKFIADEDEREEHPVIGYLAYFELLTGFKGNVYFSKEKMLKWAARYSQAFNIDLYQKFVVYQQTGEGMTDAELRKCSSPWYESFDAMAEKTVLKQLLSKKGILSIELQNAFVADTEAGYKEQQMFDAPVPVPAEPTVKAENQPVEVVEPEKEQEPVEQKETPAEPKKRGRKPVQKIPFDADDMPEQKAEDMDDLFFADSDEDDF